MSRLFFEAFPALTVRRDLKALFEETYVVRITSDRNRTRYKVYLESEHIVPKEAVLQMQREIARQVFGDPDKQVFLIERYRLSSQYRLNNLFEEYRGSLLLEMKNFSPVMSRLFSAAKISFPDSSRMEVVIPESCFSKDAAEGIRNGLESVFTSRFGLDADIRVSVRKTEQEEPEACAEEEKAQASGSAFYEEAASVPADTPPSAAPAPAGEEKKEENSEKKKTRGKHPFIYSKDPDVLYGRAFDDEPVPLDTILGESGETVVRGQIVSLEDRAIRGGKSVVRFTVTDFTDSIQAKLFLGTEFVDELKGYLTPGSFVKIKGQPQMDSFDHEVVLQPVAGIMKSADFRNRRRDICTEKRVELHCHTKMSDMDGVSECKDLVRRAYEWGMPAIAITDHGNVQAFPDAFHVRKDLLSSENGKRSARGQEPVSSEDFFKVIYGVECYLVDDLKKSVTVCSPDSENTQFADEPYVVFDLETTGFSPVKNKIIEFGAVKIEHGTITGRFSEFVNPGEPVPYRIQQLTGIRDDMVAGADPVEEVLPRFLSFAEGCRLVGHNVSFDIGFVREKAKRLGRRVDVTTLDTEGLARILLPGHAHYTLDAVAKLLDVPLENHHRAVDDAEATAGIFLKELALLEKQGLGTYGALLARSGCDPEIIKRQHMFHCILLAQNETGRVNLYRMISDSHLKYYFKKPRIPKSELIKHREGIIVGSACVMGELFQAILEDRSDETIADIVSFYDYLEIQPRDNNRFLLDEKFRDRYPDIRTEDDLLNLNRRIVKLGETFGKPVAATGDVHFLDPEDEIYRTIIQDGIGMSEEEPAPLYFRTTGEMLEEFSYLGEEKAAEVVIRNPRKIADSIEVIEPVRPDKCPPVIPDSDETLRRICYQKAHSMYGDPLPPLVENRLERELMSIISNGYSVLYIIAQKLVWKSVEDGYLVGSRGSVGSSFVATMSGITEVNPLPPHYYCPSCFYSDFDSDEVKAYAGRCGKDMPEKICPKCGKPLMKDGFDIPFETFLGFKGDKEPDIDLNFSGEYQSKAHRYTEVIFGAGQTFKAGTIGTVAEKTAYGFVKHYFEERGIPKRRCELDRLVKGCVGIRRSTGQHPGGIVVLPIGEDINTFTPVQHPANDMQSGIITTHFDYHSIDHNLLKLDILGHDDPTMIRMLQDLTGIDPLTIPIDDRDVLSLFTGLDALGITPEQNGGIHIGTLGVPEFGTPFAMGMLESTKPTYVSELVLIAGLAHGTDVWLGNAETLIKSGTATLSSCICTRDDIMTYLIGKGIEAGKAFSIMENVRKGNVAKGKCKDWPSYSEEMRNHGVPEWYIDSCRKIMYMFPKAHAAAYVMMALRIAYCKVHYPLAYYAAYYSIRATAFDYELMCGGQARLLEAIADYQARKDTLTKKEQDTLDDMFVVREMYARGFEFEPIDLKTAGARNFRIVDGKIMPALTAIANMGEKAAESVAAAVKDGPFLSVEDFRNRTKISTTLIEKLKELEILKGLPETSQISLFDLL